MNAETKPYWYTLVHLVDLGTPGTLVHWYTLVQSGTHWYVGTYKNRNHRKSFSNPVDHACDGEWVRFLELTR